MAVDSKHGEYNLRAPQWSKLRDCVAGQEAVHAKGALYLPKLSGQTDADYTAYKARAIFYGATSRTVDGLSGMVFRKAPTLVYPAAMEAMIKDVTLGGLSVTAYAEKVIEEVIVVGRHGILVDHPSVAPDTTVAQAETLNIRPFLKSYTAENIIYWRCQNINNAEILTHVRLAETVEELDKNEFDTKTIQQIRVLDLDKNNNYRQRVFRKNDKDEWVQYGPELIPLKNGAPLNFVPFWFVGVKNSSPKTEKPPLIDLANVNLSHYVSTADLEHGAHFTGLPTAVITGHVDEAETPSEFRIGAATAWVFSNPETKAYYLEFQGQGLDSLEKRIAKKEEYMAFLGARMLSPDKKTSETAETANIHRMGEVSVLSSLTAAVSETIEATLRFMAEWAGITGDIEFDLNRDFTASRMSAQELTALLALWQGGGIAFSDLMLNLKRGEILADDRDETEMLSEIETANPFNAGDVAVE